MTEGITNLIGPLNGLELVVATGQLQSSRFLNICRIKSALSESKTVSVFSFWDTRQAWQSSSQRVGINFENVNFISNELLVEFDWSNSAKSSLDGLFERISKIGSDVIILDGANLLANLVEDNEENRILLTKFCLQIACLDNIQVCLRPGGRKFGEFLVRIFAHQADQVIILQNLQTGLADDITGKLRIVRPKDEKYFTNETLFKVNERNIELVTKGLISTSGKNDFSNIA